MNVDYIIVGQGLAGSAVAIQLIKRKRTFIVFDNPDSNNSSRIAAGLFNPITGKKMVKTWLADTLFPYLNHFYQHVEQESRKKFYYPMPVYRPFLSVAEQNEWMSKSAEPTYLPYIQDLYLTKRFSQINDHHGGLLLAQAGFLDTHEYIYACGILIRQNASLVIEKFDSENLEIGDQFVRYGDVLAKNVIFCNGVHQNKWFGWLPVRPLKGETITIKNDVTEKIIINRGVYMIPLNQAGVWRVGSTYNFTDQTPCITADGKKELEEKIKTLISGPFEMIDHEWGFRPTTPDRRPILGKHPEHDRLIIFNGLGTKGVSLAPYFSEVLVHWLENGGSINKEVDIERFKSVYWGSPK